MPITINQNAVPPGEDGLTNGAGYENDAAAQAEHPDGNDTTTSRPSIDFLQLVREAEDQSSLYQAQVNRTAWSQSLRAFHNEHYVGSKYTKPEWRGRSRLFVPKTRAAVRKDGAAVAASMFNNIDAINCLAGNDGDPVQRASAALMEELVNYRTNRSSGKAALPWFLVSMGCRQDSVLTGVCLSKQSWKQTWRKTGATRAHELNPATNVYEERERAHYSLDIDRPDMQGIPAENYCIDPAADWTNPAQTAAYLLIKWPMQIDEIREKQDAPVNPWNEVDESVLKSSVENTKFDASAIRRAREMGLDRYDETQTGMTFQIVWVYEVFMRVEGEDYTFYSVGDKDFLTNPKPVSEVYPEQFGERPLALGYGALEAHRIYPMAPVESWQPLQIETNDIRNLALDATKQNVMPISKVRRGRQIDLDQVRRRSAGASIIVTDPTDVTWETPPQLGQAPVEMGRELGLEFDDLSGQQNYGTVENNNALGKTLGGLKLAAGSANAVQEYDIRVWIETWAQPALSQVVRLEQYYESSAKVLGLCGQKAKLLQKYGVSAITNELLENEITVRVSVGLGAGDPQQRLAKFQSATQVVAPLLAQTKEFQSGQVELNWEAVAEEVFGAAGYHDGGSRFFKDNGAPAQNPTAALNIQKLQSEIEKNDRMGKGSLLTGLANVAKVALGKKDLEASTVDMLMGHQETARQMGQAHGHQTNQTRLAAMEHGHRHGMAINEHRRSLTNDAHSRAQAEREFQQNQSDAAGGGAGMDGAEAGSGPSGPAPAAPSSAGAPASPSASPPPDHAMLAQLLAAGHLQFTRGPDGRISGIAMPPQRALPPPQPAQQ
jgi:hypothetical protein